MASPYFPPTTYPTENSGPAGSCGITWNRKTDVIGRYGDIWYKRTLDPVVTDVPELGKDSQRERQMLTNLDAVRSTYHDRVQSATFLSEKDKTSLNFLLDRVDALMDEIGAIYHKWENFPCLPAASDRPCPWPLSMSDNPADWAPECDGSRDSLYTQVGNRRIFERDLELPESLYADWAGPFVCPLPTDVRARSADRAKIKDMIEGVLRNIRCAQYNYWKLKLTADALRQYRKGMYATGFTTEQGPTVTPGLSGGFGFSSGAVAPPDGIPTPGGSVGGAEEDEDAGGIPDVRPEDEEDTVVDSDLPDMDGEEPGGFGEDAGETGEGTRDSSGAGTGSGIGAREGATPSQSQQWLKYGAIALGTTALGVVLYRTLK